MPERYTQVPVSAGRTRFNTALGSDVEHSTVLDNPQTLTTFNAGRVVPVYWKEILPGEGLKIDVQAVVRQLTLQVPVMGELYLDLDAFFVPNRIVNQSWTNVMGENSAGSWANETSVTLAPLYIQNAAGATASPESVQIPVGSIANYYGLPSQQALSATLLSGMNDLLFRGYIEIYNEYYRDQNYMPPVPYSKLNVYEGFLSAPSAEASVRVQSAYGVVFSSSSIPFSGASGFGVPYDTYLAWSAAGTAQQSSDGSFDTTGNIGALVKALYGEGVYERETISSSVSSQQVMQLPRRLCVSMLSEPWRACKLHDYFTSVLPSPQKGQAAFVPVDVSTLSISGKVPVAADAQQAISVAPVSNLYGLRVAGIATNSNGQGTGGSFPTGGYWTDLRFTGSAGGGTSASTGVIYNGTETYSGSSGTTTDQISPLNLFANLGSNGFQTGATPGYGAQFSGGVQFSVNDLRMSAAVQQLYELMARSGSRYREVVSAFFGIEADDPFSDIPRHLGHVRRTLNLYQVAQTSASVEGSTSAANLTAFGYTNTGGNLINERFLEHGYVHIMAVVRQKNVYPSMIRRSWFRQNQLDWYWPQLANISEQPVYVREINPFNSSDSSKTNVFGYQEAWQEYRQTPDSVTGYLAGGIEGSLDVWTYADDFSSTLGVADAAFMVSNAEAVVNRSSATTSEIAPQFKAFFTWNTVDELPMPTASVPGMDVI